MPNSTVDGAPDQSRSTPPTEALGASDVHGLTPERVRKRRRRKTNRQQSLRFSLLEGLTFTSVDSPLPDTVRVLAKTHHVYTITESRESLARDAFERLLRDMGANAALNVTTREDTERYGKKIFKRFVIKGTPAVVGTVSTAPTAITKAMAAKHFPNAAVVRAYQRRARDLEEAKRKIRTDESFESRDSRLARNALFVLIVLVAAAALFSWLGR